MRPPLTMIHEDGQLVVVNKRSGMIVHRGWARDDDDALRTVRDQVGQRVFPVHRLDRGTSGVLIFAKDSRACAAVREQIEAGTVSKGYLALVRGRFGSAPVLDHPVSKGEKGQRVAATTAFVPVSTSNKDRCSLVAAAPRTGRLHQIRRHLKHLSHPIVGDVRYGKGDINRRYRERWNLHRLALHAAAFRLAHPRTGIDTVFEAPLSDDLRGPLESLGLCPPPEVLSLLGQ